MREKVKTFDKNKFTIEGINYEQTHSSGYFSAVVSKRSICYTLNVDPRYNLLIYQEFDYSHQINFLKKSLTISWTNVDF